MAESEEVVSTVKTSNHPVATEPALNLGKDYEEICNLVSEMRIIAAKQTKEEHNNKISKFFECEPPCFGDDTDPLVAKFWVLKLENIFDLIGFSDEQKVCLASLRLKDCALSWWIVAQRQLNADGIKVTWEKFKELFDNRYFPCWLKAQKYRELCNLEQGDRTVAEYDKEFIKLSSLVSEFISTDDAWEAHMFDNGLRADIRLQLCFVKNESYHKVRNMALMVEQRLINQEM